jgi:nitrate/TMAO reductase-like tetraheme cytochrome c subunit
MNCQKYFFGIMVMPFLFFTLFLSSAAAKPSPCEDCHLKLNPGIVKDFNRGKMAQKLTCKSCHGKDHMSAEDVDKVKLPTIKTCKKCHSKQAKQYMSGKHALGLLPITAFPGFAHQQPQAFIDGQKGCNGCHNLGITDEKVRDSTAARKYYKYGMDC